MKWNDESSYDYTASHDVRDWGWEFIRRDDRYKAEWDDIFAKYDPKKSPFWNIIGDPEISVRSDKHYLEDINLTKPDEIETFVILSNNDALKWGLTGYQNPNSKKLSKSIIAPVKKLHICEYYMREFALEGVSPSVKLEAHTLLSVIDIKKPIKPQIDEISKRALQIQKELRSKEPELVRLRSEKVSSKDRKRWKNYLRCIDAQQSKVKENFAAKKIFSNIEGKATPDERWRETIRQIEEIKEKNYNQFMA